MTKPDLKASFIWGLDTPGADGIPPIVWAGSVPVTRRLLTRWFTVGNQVGWSPPRAAGMSLGVPPDTFVRTIDRPHCRGSVIWSPPQSDPSETEGGTIKSRMDPTMAYRRRETPAAAS